MAARASAVPRLRFCVEDDLALLSEVNASNPFKDPSRWTVITKNVQAATGKAFSVRALRERLDLLLAQFVANDLANLRK